MVGNVAQSKSLLVLRQGIVVIVWWEASMYICLLDGHALSMSTSESISIQRVLTLKNLHSNHVQLARKAHNS